MSCPSRIVGVVGTSTEVGKTWVTAHVCEELRSRGRSVAARKPVQSYDPSSSEPTDATVLAAATGDDPTIVCRPGHSLAVPMAPPMAADALGLEPISMARLLQAIEWPDRVCDVGFVEAVGGVRSPVAVDGDSADLVRLTGADVVLLVADVALGAIDRVRSALDTLDALGDRQVITHLNRFDPDDDLHRRNLAWFREVDGIEPTTSIAEVADRILSQSPT